MVTHQNTDQLKLHLQEQNACHIQNSIQRNIRKEKPHGGNPNTD